MSSIRFPLCRCMSRSRLLMGCLCALLLTLNLMQAILEGTKLSRTPSRRLALENIIDLLERFPSSLRVEEEDVDSHDGAEGSKDHVRLPFYHMLVGNWQQVRGWAKSAEGAVVLLTDVSEGRWDEEGES